MTLNKRSSVVTQTCPASPEVSQLHYFRKLSFETDCADVHAAFSTGTVDFTLLDVRGPNSFRKAHVPGATNLPRDKITVEVLNSFEHKDCFVVYCAGPHCNGADKAAEKIASLRFPVKIMIGGVTGWREEGFKFIEESDLPQN